MWGLLLSVASNFVASAARWWFAWKTHRINLRNNAVISDRRNFLNIHIPNCKIVQLGERPTFRRNISSALQSCVSSFFLPPCPILKMEAMWCHNAQCRPLHSHMLERLRYDVAYEKSWSRFPSAWGHVPIWRSVSAESRSQPGSRDCSNCGNGDNRAAKFRYISDF
jgi:hypothetical protein